METGSESQDARSTRTPQHLSLPQNQDWESRTAAKGPEDPEEKQQPHPTWQGTSCCHPTEDKTRGPSLTGTKPRARGHILPGERRDSEPPGSVSHRAPAPLPHRQRWRCSGAPERVEGAKKPPATRCRDGGCGHGGPAHGAGLGGAGSPLPGAAPGGADTKSEAGEFVLQ